MPCRRRRPRKGRVTLRSSGLNGRLYIGTHANAVNSWLVEFDPQAKQMKVVVDAHKAIGKDLQGLRRAGEDSHPQQRRRKRQDLLRHQARLSRQDRETRGLSRRLPDGLRPEDRQDEGLSDPGAAPGHQQHHARRDARRGVHLDLLRPSPRPRRERGLPDPRPEDRQVPRADGHRALLRLHRRRLPGPGVSSDPRRRHRPLRSPGPTSSSGSSRRSTASRRRRRVAAGPDAEARSDQLGHLARRQDAVLRCR